MVPKFDSKILIKFEVDPNFNCMGRYMGPSLWVPIPTPIIPKKQRVQDRVAMDTFIKKGAVRESNPRPLAPEARIIPLDQRPAMLASIEDRTRDLLLTRQMLCQLSYRGGSLVSGAWCATDSVCEVAKDLNPVKKGPWGN